MLPTPEEEARVKRILRRDFLFLAIAMVAGSLMSFIEMNAGDASLRGGVADERGIVDTGYILTAPLHAWLQDHRDWNDFFALLNTLALAFPGIYTIYVTLLFGDFDLVFRYLATHILRSFCGWFTYLPSSSEYLMSYSDVPDIWQCLLKECGDASKEPVQPFVSFFSGHVATMVCCANHAYINGYRRLGVFMHVLNALQVVRMLATRGHYSIDMIIGWCMAVYVSRPAGRLGRYFSRGGLEEITTMEPKEMFERIIGVDAERKERRMSMLARKVELQSLVRSLEQEEINLLRESVMDTTVTLAAAAAAAEAEAWSDRRKSD